MLLNCPRCQQENDFPESLAGSEARCSACGGLISVPVPEGVTAPSAAQPGDAESGGQESIGGASDGHGSVYARLEGAQVTDSEVIDPTRVPAARPRPLWTKLVLVGLPLLLGLGGVGGYLAVVLERQNYAKQVDTSFKNAEALYVQGKFEECEKGLASAEALLDARPEAVPVGADMLRSRAKVLRTNIGKWRDACEIMNGVSIKPAATRRRIDDLFKVVTAMGPDAAPVARTIGEMSRRAYGHELADRRKNLEDHLKSLQKQLDAAEFAAVREAIKLAREDIAKAPKKMSGELTKIFSAKLAEIDAALKQQAEIDKIVKAAPRGGPERETLKAEVLKRREALITKGVAAKGFTKQFEKWLAELRRDRRDLPTAVRTHDLQDIATDFAAAGKNLELVPGSLDEKLALFRLKSDRHHYRVQRCNIGGQVQFMIEVDGIRLSFPAPRNTKVRRKLAAYEMAQAVTLAATLKASGHKEAWSKAPWQVYLLGPLQGAQPTAVLRGKALVCTGGRVWNVKTRQTQTPLSEAGRSFITAARELETAIKEDLTASKELRGMLVLMVKAAYERRKSASDFLPRQFCSAAVARGYVNKNAPGLAVRVRSKLAAYKTAYTQITRFIPGLVGKTPAGDEIEWSLNADGRTLWRFYDKKSDATTFALGHNDAQYQTRFFVHTTFAGNHAKWPATEMPRKVRMVHQAVGEVASWDPQTDKPVFDVKKWNRATELEQFSKPAAHFGAPYWRFPPHVLLVDSVGNALGMVTPNGRLDMPEFGKRRGEARRKAQDAFMNKCAKTLKSAGELHLLFRYFVKYTYDSPLTEYPFLIGDKTHTGDVHQDAYQTLDRKIAGRFIADCDDLAEFYQEVTRRQGRQSFVLGRPGHAICGFIEKQKQDYVFTAVDTGPPRQFQGVKLDDVVETALATFDEEHTEAFDPNSVCFLLRFAGEQTRTPYYLGTRMFLDPKYAKTMIRVQRDWHFAYISSGKETMAEMVKREKDSPTLFELAAFYRELGEWPQAIAWAKKGIAALDPGDTMGKLTENFRLAGYLDRSGNKQAAVDLLKGTARKVEKAEAAAGAKAQRFAGLRLNLASHLEGLDHPFFAWQVARPAARKLEASRKLGGHNATRLADILLSMRDLERGGRKLDAGEKTAVKELEALLTRHFATRHFKERDTFRTHMDKYSDLAIFYAAKHGRQYALTKLLAPGPYPQGTRAHHRRVGDAAKLEAEDWKWIRISMHAYNYFFHNALDGRKPVAKRRTAEAVRILAALEKAIPEIRKRGSLGGMEFALMGLRVRRDAIAKNWSGMAATFKQTRKRNWGRLYRLISMSLGDAASYMSADDFETQFRSFCAQKPPLPHYYRVVYEALSNKRYEHALRAARITAESFPDNADVQREFKLLRELLRKRPRETDDGKKEEKKTSARDARKARIAA